MGGAWALLHFQQLCEDDGGRRQDQQQGVKHEQCGHLLEIFAGMWLAAFADPLSGIAGR